MGRGGVGEAGGERDGSGRDEAALTDGSCRRAAALEAERIEGAVSGVGEEGPVVGETWVGLPVPEDWAVPRHCTGRGGGGGAAWRSVARVFAGICRDLPAGDGDGGDVVVFGGKGEE